MKEQLYIASSSKDLLIHFGSYLQTFTSFFKVIMCQPCPLSPIPDGPNYQLLSVGGGALDAPTPKIGPNLARKVLKTVLESSQKIMGGNIYTQNVKKCQLHG